MTTSFGTELNHVIKTLVVTRHLINSV